MSTLNATHYCIKCMVNDKSERVCDDPPHHFMPIMISSEEISSSESSIPSSPTPSMNSSSQLKDISSSPEQSPPFDTQIKVTNKNLEFFDSITTASNVDYIKSRAHQLRSPTESCSRIINDIKKNQPLQYNLIPNLNAADKWTLWYRLLKEGERWLANEAKERLYSDEMKPFIKFMKQGLLAPTYTINEVDTLRSLAEHMNVTTTHLAIAIFGGADMREPPRVENPTHSDEALIKFSKAAIFLAANDNLSGSDLKKHVPQMAARCEKTEASLTRCLIDDSIGLKRKNWQTQEEQQKQQTDVKDEDEDEQEGDDAVIMCTPDILFTPPEGILLNGRRIHWIECKSGLYMPNLTSERQVNNLIAQVKKYEEHFGPGAIFWSHGYILRNMAELLPNSVYHLKKTKGASSGGKKRKRNKCKNKKNKNKVTETK